MSKNSLIYYLSTIFFLNSYKNSGWNKFNSRCWERQAEVVRVVAEGRGEGVLRVVKEAEFIEGSWGNATVE